MRSLTANILSCVCIASIEANIVLAQVESADKSQTIHLTPFHGPDVTGVTHFENCQWLYPLDDPNEKLVSEPGYQSSKRVYYAARYGEGKDNIFTLVLDESRGTGTGFNTVYADLNNDNRIMPDTERFGFQLGTTQSAEPVRITLLISAGGKTIPYAFEFTAFPYKDGSDPAEKIQANCRNSTIVMGEAVFGGKQCKVALADLDSNGLFNDYEQYLFGGDRFFVDIDGDGSFSDDSSRGESVPYAEYAKIGLNWYTIEASPDGGTVQIRASKPAFGMIKVAGHVKSVGLTSPRQFQRIEPKDGKAEALAGTYQVRDVTLEIVDSDGQRWSTRGTCRSAGPRVSIGPDQETTLDGVLPLTIQVAVQTTAEPGVIQLEPRIVDSHGGTFSTLRKNNARHEPPAKLLIKDADGKQVAEANLEYG